MAACYRHPPALHLEVQTASRRSAVILFTPIVQGLAISLAAGEIVSSLCISRMAVAVIYAALYRMRTKRSAAEGMGLGTDPWMRLTRLERNDDRWVSWLASQRSTDSN